MMAKKSKIDEDCEGTNGGYSIARMNESGQITATVREGSSCCGTPVA